MSDRRVTYADIEEAFGLSAGTVNNIITEDLCLVKKSARWVPCLLDEGKKMGVDLSRNCVRLAASVPNFLGRVVTMDESATSFHTPETKQKSNQWLPKRTPGPIKAWIHTSRKKQMVFSFFDNKGLIYQHYVDLGAKVNAAYTVEVMTNFLRIFRCKRHKMAAGEFFCTGTMPQCILQG